MVTKSACPQQLLEGFSGVTDLLCPAPSTYGRPERKGLFTPLQDRPGRRVFESALLLSPVRSIGEPLLAVC